MSVSVSVSVSVSECVCVCLCLCVHVHIVGSFFNIGDVIQRKKKDGSSETVVQKALRKCLSCYCSYARRGCLHLHLLSSPDVSEDSSAIQDQQL